RERRGGGARGLGALHCAQREPGQLAGGVVLRRDARPRAHSAAGAGRARLRIKSATASPDSPALCSTRPKPAAASAIVTRTSEGRKRLSTAVASAVQPNTE